MNVNDAKKKMCPLAVTSAAARNLSDHFFSGTRQMGIKLGEGNVYLRTVCITTECMAWIETEKDEGSCGMIPGCQGRNHEGTESG